MLLEKSLLTQVRLFKRALPSALAVISLFSLAPTNARGQGYQILYAFCVAGANCTDGSNPVFSGVVKDAAGNLYGTTGGGGNANWGTVFKLDPNGNESVLYSFCSASGCADGAQPQSGVVLDGAGNLYGTTVYNGGGYQGTVFKVPNTNQETILRTLGNVSPNSLIRDASGNLYGTTDLGGAHFQGSVFKIDSGGNYTLLHSFCAQMYCSDGTDPDGGLIEDAAGNLYGTTNGGGINVLSSVLGAGAGGTVFKLSSAGQFTVLYNFCPAANCPDGAGPVGSLLRDAAGNLYGVTDEGGAHGAGAVFKVDTSGNETVLWSFCSASNCTDGQQPRAGLVQDAAGNLYGTTQLGGAFGAGTVFKLDTAGNETVLHHFGASPGDGLSPLAPLLLDATNTLYGTTTQGGFYSNGTSYGTVFKLGTVAPAGSPGKLLGPCNSIPGEPSTCDPIIISTGNVSEQTTDYTTTGQNPLGLTRYYNSLGNTSAVATFALSLGVNWRSTYDRYLNVTSASSVTAERADGQQLTFALIGGTWAPDTDVDVTLTNEGTQWTLTDHNDVVEIYREIGANEAQLQSVTARNGYTQSLFYNSSHQLILVVDSYGRAFRFVYGASGLLQTVTTPDNTTLSYGYTATSGGNVLTSVTYSTTPAATITYHYQNASFPLALTSIMDEDGNDYATWTYDSFGRAQTSQLGGSADLTRVIYNSDGSRAVTNALGVTDTYKFTTLQGIPKVTEIDRAATSTTVAATELFTYDSNGYEASQTDWNGNQTTYVNDRHGDPTTINEGVGSPVARATTISYDSIWVHLPKQIITQGLTANFTYDGSGELLTKTLTDTTVTTSPFTTSGQVRATTNSWSGFLIASTTNPNGNTTKFTYDSTGALIKISNAMNQTISVTAHTGGGQPLTVVDPNGVTTNLIYDARQRLLTSTVITSAGPLTTANSYDATGNLIKTTLPDGSALTNTYDTAHRLTAITDLFHQSTAYTLDALGDRTKTNLTAVGNRIQRQHSDNFDALGRTLQDIGGAGQITTYGYDPNGNALTIRDRLGRITSQSFDALNRLSRVTDPNSGVTATSYDAHDRVLNVADPNGNATVYLYDGFGDLIQQTSPDSGITVYRFDADGNLVHKEDAAGNVTNSTYDALDRILTTTFPDNSALNVAYTYDQPGHGFGVGRLTSLTDAAGSLSRSYDERGNLLADTRVNGATTLKTVYTYDAASRLASTTYPSGWTISQTRDIMGRIWQLPVTAPGGASAGSAITNATYEPFGPLYTLSYGNGVNESRRFDLDYRVTSLADAGTSALQNLTYAYDANDNLSSIGDGVTPANSQMFGYDVLNRLAGATGAYGVFGWTYDKLGNRLTQTLGGVTTAYGYTAGTNRLASITVGSSMTPVNYTATGNISSIPPTPGAPVATLSYNAANRLASVTGTTVAIVGMVYDAFGQRFSKSAPGSSPILYTYDQNGNLLEENENGFPIDYVYLNGRPVAEVTGGKVYYLHADRLGTPQLVTDAGQNIVWSTSYQPFGTTSLPAGTISQNLRFPGQYFDGETGWNHNGWRDYVPDIGRYGQSDPAGLAGGSDTYLYVGANPLNTFDLLGLCAANARPDIWDAFWNGYGPLRGNGFGDWLLFDIQVFASLGSLPEGGVLRATALLRQLGHDETGALYLWKGFQIARDLSGKVHGILPRFVPTNWTRAQLLEAAQELRLSIEIRSQELLRLGEEGAHRARIEEERRLLLQIEKKLN
jgi:RHS repeat-associated protein